MEDWVIHIMQEGRVTHKWSPEEIISILNEAIWGDIEGDTIISDVKRATKESIFTALNFYKTSTGNWRMVLHLTHELSIGDDVSKIIYQKLGS